MTLAAVHWKLVSLAVDSSARFMGKIITLHPIPIRDKMRATCFGKPVGSLTRISDSIYEGQIFGQDVRVEPGQGRGMLRIMTRAEGIA